MMREFQPLSNVRMLATAMILCAGLAAGPVAATDTDIDVAVPEAIAANLQKQVGKRVALKLTSGQELEGTVAKVGPAAVHLSQLAGKEFFDAVVRLDHVTALIVRTKTK